MDGAFLVVFCKFGLLSFCVCFLGVLVFVFFPGLVLCLVWVSGFVCLWFGFGGGGGVACCLLF